MNAVLAFWAAYILTRPFGASFADWIGKARDAGGLGIGDGTIAGILAVLIVGGVVYLTRERQRPGRQRSTLAPEPCGRGSLSPSS